jgi:hypothetical protein
MLTGCIISYDDYPLIKKCVESIIDQVDRLIIVDGRYRDFPGSSMTSTGDTKEYLNEINGGKVQVIYAGNLTEVDKRNIYLEQVSDGDIILNLDADEVLVGNIKPLEKDFGIVEFYINKHRDVRASRFFKYREGMRYRLVHFTLYYNNKQVNKLKKVINNDFSFEHIEAK